MTTINWMRLKSRVVRIVIGSGMSILAWVLERAILRSAEQD